MIVYITFSDGKVKIYDDVKHIRFLDSRYRCLALVRKDDFQTLINWDCVKTLGYDQKKVDIVDLNMD